MDKKSELEGVEGPDHYTYGTIEVIDYIDQVCSIYPGHEAFYVANVIKYLSRAPLKRNKKVDLLKALDYMERLVGKVSNNNNSVNKTEWPVFSCKKD